MEHAETGEQGGRTFFLKLEPGEAVAASLLAFAEARGVEGATVEAIGAVRDAELGWFDTESLAYRTQRFPGTLELVSLLGTLGRSDGASVLHAHASCADRTLGLVGGHLVEARVAVTVEACLRETGLPLRRREDERFGLRLLDLGPEEA